MEADIIEVDKGCVTIKTVRMDSLALVEIRCAGKDDFIGGIYD